MKPNLFIVGAGKCGTTSLYGYLDAHPDVFMSPLKEPSYFIDDLRNPHWITDREQYLALFDGATNHRYAGEASAAYLFSKTAAGRIYDFNPDARIIIALRNPVDKMFSLHRHMLLYENQTIKDFRRALEVGTRRKIDKRFTPSLFDYRKRAALTEQVRRFVGLFPSKQVHIVLFDDLATKATETYQKLLDFLDLPSTGTFDAKIRNASRTYRWRFLNQILRNPPRFVRRLTEPVRSTRVFQNFVERINDFNSGAPLKLEFDSELRGTLLAEFHQEILSLGELIGKDLSHWLKAKPPKKTTESNK